jgi:hypothetical protein
VRPGAVELCDGEDEDCDGEVDDNAADARTWYADADGDRTGDPASPLRACAAPPGAVGNNRDCADDDPDRFPGNPERCDGLDQDCDAPDQPVPADAPLWYVDGDGDGQGVGAGVAACAAPAGTAPVAGDCDDAAADVFVGAPEQCNVRDDDCDRQVDEDVTAFSSWRDGDGDGWGDPAVEQQGCALAPGFVLRADDCDDGVRTVSPSATEVCNGVDDDCDGAIDDEAVDRTVVYADLDGDGWGAGAELACAGPGAVLRAGDCDDAADAVHPQATELCDGVDGDCDGEIDEGAADRVTAFVDGDGDGWGADGSGALVCPAPGLVRREGDCDDARAEVNPTAAEVCDGADDDCDGAIDGGAIDRERVYDDSDGDGWGAGAGRLTCAGPEDVLVAGDCDDADGARHPGVVERCDGVDQDCDTVIDDAAVDAEVWYVDADGDGFGGAAFSLVACAAPVGWVGDATDCDDLEAADFPGATERCDGVDNDCDGEIDEGAVGGDGDGDGVCDFEDQCLGDDATGDTDEDGVCDDGDQCRGDDAAGDSDGDEVCDDVDLCLGDDAVGDADEDGACDDVDQCLGDDAAGDADGDGLCDDRDLCLGDDASGDTDGDGVCDDSDPCVFGPEIRRDVLFFDDFEGGLGQWVGKSAGAHSGLTVADPRRAGNLVLTWTQMNSGGDIFSRQTFYDPSQSYELSFQYLGDPTRGGVPGNLGGFIGFSQGFPDVHTWIAGTDPGWFTAAPQALVDDGTWQRVTITVSYPVPAHVMLEDFVTSGRAGDAFFDDVKVAVVVNDRDRDGVCDADER